ncbi:hypothetical protein PPTG_24951 [Phytophthora nicotianae INRA-310]|uniref:Uncharacterized protein n=1 Tax=Phytophthora nicotianae (strain INRA-310) TaxID=761204 RepID=W2P8U9_PHYN3|nr:hypothetical protein PPTG_24951 [Phytophthora nicotianae INRA-310]ETM97437.1 hypothetical protein PPTG_24951 [Phytophthora nicotianae INRA-310]
MEEEEASSSSAAESKAAESTPDPLTGSRERVMMIRTLQVQSVRVLEKRHSSHQSR